MSRKSSSIKRDRSGSIAKVECVLIPAAVAMERCLNSVCLFIRASETGSSEMFRSTGRRIMKIVVIDGTG